MKHSASLLLLATCLITGCASTAPREHDAGELASRVMAEPHGCPVGLVPSCPANSLLIKGHNNNRSGCECVSADEISDRRPF